MHFRVENKQAEPRPIPCNKVTYVWATETNEKQNQSDNHQNKRTSEQNNQSDGGENLSHNGQIYEINSNE